MKFYMTICGLCLVFGCLFGGCSADGTGAVEEGTDETVPTKSQASTGGTEGPVQVLETDELMKILMDPIYEDLKDWIEVPPERRKQWRGLYVAAFTLAEVTNLLYSRTGEEYTDNEEWVRLTTEALDITVRLAESVREQADYETLKSNYLAVVESCNVCHERFNTDEPPEIDVPRAWMKDEDKTEPKESPFN